MSFFEDGGSAISYRMEHQWERRRLVPVFDGCYAPPVKCQVPEAEFYRFLNEENSLTLGRQSIPRRF